MIFLFLWDGFRAVEVYVLGDCFLHFFFFCIFASPVFPRMLVVSRFLSRIKVYEKKKKHLSNVKERNSYFCFHQVKKSF